MVSTRSRAIDFTIERQRHAGFVGRADLLARLDQLVITDRADRWVVVTGGPGMGKSAVIAAWLARREAAGEVVPHHFIRRGWANWDDPETLVDSLVAQIETRFPEQREPEADGQLAPAARLAASLLRVSQHVLVSRGKRLVLLIDGLDEYERRPGAPPGDPLAAFLPYALPPGVSVLCASRPRPYVDLIAARGALVQLDLDDMSRYADDNAATVRALWEQVAPQLGLNAPFIDEAVERAGGNVLHAVTLREHLAGLPSAQRRVEDIPRGLAALVASAWERIATGPLVVHGLGILCAAREALTLDELGTVAGWAGEPPRRAFLGEARELLIESRRADHKLEYRLHHESIRAYVAEAIGADALAGHHRALALKLATWPSRKDRSARRYALRHSLLHRTEAGEWTDAWRVAGDTSFLEAKCRALGVEDVEADIARLAERCRSDGVGDQRFDDLARALARESYWLRIAPEATPALVWNRLRRLGWSTRDLAAHLRLPDDSWFLRLRHATTRESPALVRSLEGHTLWVYACAVTSDSRHVVSASADNTLKVWDLASGRAVATLQGHTSFVTACTVTLDSRHAISASADNTLKVWDLASGRAMATLQGHLRPVTACAVTPDGQHMVSASVEGTLRVWDLASGRTVAMLQGHSRPVTACVVTLDGRHVVSASADNTLKVWDLASGRTVATLQGHTRSVTACAVTPDGRHVVSASDDQTLRIWELGNARAMATLQGHTQRVTACAVTPDGGHVVSASDDQTLKVWELGSMRALATLRGHTQRVTACVVTPDGRYVVSASADNTLKVWELASARGVAMLEGHTDRVWACAVTPEGRHVVSASADNTLKIWELATGRAVATLEDHTRSVTACAVTPDGRHVVSVSQDGTLKVWELASGQASATYRMTACAVTPDGRYVVSASPDNTRMTLDPLLSGRQDYTLTVRELASGRVTAMLEGHVNVVTACVATPDGRHVVSASHDNTLKVWELTSGREVDTLGGHARGVTACAVTPDGRYVVSASLDQTLKVWKLASRRVVATLKGHTNGVTACAVTPDSRHVVSASGDKTLKVWDLKTFACLGTHRGDAGYTAVIATATAIFAGDETGSVWLLNLPPSPRSSPAAADGHAHISEPTFVLDEVRSPMKHTILYVAANPLEIDRLALDEECAAIVRELRMTSGRDDFDFHSKWAVNVDELMRHLNELQPTVLHFSGHASIDDASSSIRSGDPQRDITGTRSTGILVQEGQSRQYVSDRELAKMIASAAPSTRVVVLNACYSAEVADSLRHEVDCVVGMDDATADTAARSFAVAFYRALGHRRSIANAVDQAAATLAAKHPGARPLCVTRDSLRADRIFLPTVERSRPGPEAQQARTTAASQPGAATAPSNVDVGILTILYDEFLAVLNAFPDRIGTFKGTRTNREYSLHRADVGGGAHYTLALLRQIEPGEGEAQSAARDLIEDLSPRLILVVGIAGGVPSADVTLGDVVLSTRIHDFTVEARNTDEAPTYSTTGGPVSKVLAAAIANLPVRKAELGAWTRDLPAQPTVSWDEKDQLYGPKDWQAALRAKLERHYRSETGPRAPIYADGPIASSDRLVKDPELLIPWLQTARKLLAVEMESGGVYRAAQDRCFMLAIRGISDIVGLKRSDDWKKYACASAAAFSRAFLRTRPVGDPL